MPAILNDAFYPLLLMAIEEPFTEAELDAYIKKLAAISDEAIRRSTRHVAILTTDPTHVSAAGRKKIAEFHNRHLTPAQISVTIASFVTINSAIVRGVLTAFRWLSPETVKSLRAVSSVDEALDEALRVLDGNGTPFTGDARALRRALGLKS